MGRGRRALPSRGAGDGGAAERARRARPRRRRPRVGLPLHRDGVPRRRDAPRLRLHARAAAVAEAVDHAIQVLAALAEAHAAGHRPSRSQAGERVPHDGRRRQRRSRRSSTSASRRSAARRRSARALTRTGAVIGTVAYMAPEQMLDAKRVDGRADLWSVGLMLYECLAQQHPFGSATSANVVTAILSGRRSPLSTLRPDRAADARADHHASASRRSPSAASRPPRGRDRAGAVRGPALARRARRDSSHAAAEGAAAPLASGMAHTPRSGRVTKTSTPPPMMVRGPNVRTNPSVTATTGPAAATRKPQAALGLMLSFVLAGLAIGVVAGFTLYAKPRGKPGAATNAAQPVSAPVASPPAAGTVIGSSPATAGRNTASPPARAGRGPPRRRRRPPGRRTVTRRTVSIPRRG